PLIFRKKGGKRHLLGPPIMDHRPPTSATDFARADRLCRRSFGRRRFATGLYSISRPDLAWRTDKKVGWLIAHSPSMSAIRPKQTWASYAISVAIGSKADMAYCSANVRL